MSKNKNLNLQTIHFANQQFTGFYQAFKGYSITSLVQSMNLTKAEFKEMMKLDMINYLPPELIKEISEAVKN